MRRSERGERLVMTMTAIGAMVGAAQYRAQYEADADADAPFGFAPLVGDSEESECCCGHGCYDLDECYDARHGEDGAPGPDGYCVFYAAPAESD